MEHTNTLKETTDDDGGSKKPGCTTRRTTPDRLLASTGDFLVNYPGLVLGALASFGGAWFVRRREEDDE